MSCLLTRHVCSPEPPSSPSQSERPVRLLQHCCSWPELRAASSSSNPSTQTQFRLVHRLISHHASIYFKRRRRPVADQEEQAVHGRPQAATSDRAQQQATGRSRARPHSRFPGREEVREAAAPAPAHISCDGTPSRLTGAHSIIAYCNSTRDYMVPSVWGAVPRGEDPYAPQQSGGCCMVM